MKKKPKLHRNAGRRAQPLDRKALTKEYGLKPTGRQWRNFKKAYQRSIRAAQREAR